MTLLVMFRLRLLVGYHIIFLLTFLEKV